MYPAILDFESIDWGGRGFAYALEQSHLPGLVVAVILLLLSVVSWSIMFSKLGMVGKAARQNFRFVYAFRRAKTTLAPYEANVSVPGSTIFHVYRAGCRELAYHLLGSTDPDELSHAQARMADEITPDQMDSVRAAMDRSIGEMTLFLEARMNLLATAVSGAPFLGLLGTVWGVMETFGGVASAGAGGASLQSMAPGVAAALVTTVIALLVAIPAMFGYNFLINRIRTLILEMHNFSAELSSLLERQFVDFAPPSVTVVHQQAAAAAPVPPIGYPSIEDVSPPSMSAMGAAVVPALQDTTRWRPMADDAFPRGGGRSGGRDEFGVPINPIAQQAARRRNA